MMATTMKLLAFAIGAGVWLCAYFGVVHLVRGCPECTTCTIVQPYELQP